MRTGSFVKKLNIGLILFFMISPFVQGNEMTQIEKISHNLQFLIVPTGEDDAYFDKFEKLCSCVGGKVSKQLSNEQLNDFSKQLGEFAEQSESAANNMELLLKNGPPKPSEKLISYLQLIQEPIEACEKQYKIRVEF
jgi:hypothetical protein